MTDRVAVELVEARKLAIVRLQRQPVNAMDLKMFEALQQALDQLESNPKVRMVIFCSGLQGAIFTAGNDLQELYAPATSEEGYSKFWKVSQTFFIRLYNSSLVTVAAINGACPAGGCMLSMMCDWRVAAADAKMGLNEVAIGISVPKFWGLCMATILGTSQAERLCMGATMVPAKDGLRMGLVDKVVETREELLAAAEAIAAPMAKLPPGGKGAVKNAFRSKLSEEWEDFIEAEAQGGWAMLSDPKTVAAMKATLDGLSGKGKAKAKL